MTELSKSDWQETLTGEMLLLSLLSRIYYKYPDNKERVWLQTLFNEDVFSVSPFASDNDEIIIGLDLLRKWGENGLTSELFEQIRADYTRMFIGPGQVIVAPWESVYSDKGRLTFQEETLDVRNWYRGFGLEAERIHQEPDDHIGLELLFLSHLASLGIKALDDQDISRFEDILEAKREFLKKHTGKWALKFCELIIDNARTDFYKGVAQLTSGTLSALAVHLGVDSVRESA